MTREELRDYVDEQRTLNNIPYHVYSALVDGIDTLEQQPRKGEWLRMSDLSEQEDDRYKCSRCGNVIHHKDEMNLYTFNSWCGRCGSDNGRHITYEVEEC